MRNGKRGPVLALIGARGGSRGIPKKNIADLCGYPLIAYTISAAKKSGAVDRIIVSTDSEEIAGVALKWGAEVPFLRPASLAGDQDPLMMVDLHSIHTFWEMEKQVPFAAVSLMPTYPFLKPQSIAGAVRKILEGEDTVGICVKSDAGRKLFFLNDSGAPKPITFYTVAKDVYLACGALSALRDPPVYNPIGRTYHDYLAWANQRQQEMAKAGIYLKPGCHIPVHWTEAIDIDTPKDLAFARGVIETHLLPHPLDGSP